MYRYVESGVILNIFKIDRVLKSFFKYLYSAMLERIPLNSIVNSQVLCSMTNVYVYFSNRVPLFLILLRLYQE